MKVEDPLYTDQVSLIPPTLRNLFDTCVDLHTVISYEYTSQVKYVMGWIFLAMLSIITLICTAINMYRH